VTCPKLPSSSLNLAHTTSGDLVQLDALGEPPVSNGGVLLGLREGEVVQCLRNDAFGVLVVRPDGTRVLVPRSGARQVGVRWFPARHARDRSTASP
jgi:hypothetical protein